MHTPADMLEEARRIVVRMANGGLTVPEQNRSLDEQTSVEEAAANIFRTINVASAVQRIIKTYEVKKVQAGARNISTERQWGKLND